MTPISLLAYMMVIKIVLDVMALFPVHFGDTLNHQVVAFGGAAGEDNFLRRSANQSGDLRACIYHGFFTGPTERVITAGSVAKFFGEIGQHRLQHARIDLSGGVIIEINWQLYGHILFSCCSSYARRGTSICCSCGSSHICAMVTVFKTFITLSFTRRSGSRTEHLDDASQFP